MFQIDVMYGAFSAAKWLVPFIDDASLSCGLKVDATKEQLQFLLHKFLDL